MHTIYPHSLIQGVVFDFGSTLTILPVAWSEVIAAGARAVVAHLAEAGLELPADFADRWAAALHASIRQAEADGIERPAEVVLAGLLAELGHDGPPDGLLRQAMDGYFAVEDALRVPAAGALSLLAELDAAGYRVGVLSNTISGRWVQHAVDRFGFRPYLKAVVTSDEIGVRKPRPAAFQAALGRLGLADPARAVMVGDTVSHDIVGAKGIGMRTILITLAEDRSFSTRSALSVHPPAPDGSVVPDAAVTRLAEVARIIERWQGYDG